MSQTIITTPPTWEPVSLAEAKAHMRIDGADEDALVWSKLIAARSDAEGRTGLTLPTQQLELHLDSWPRSGTIPLAGPVDVDSVTITYRDLQGTEHTVDPSRYKVTLSSAWPIGGRWPCPTAPSDAVTVAYSAGYANADAIPGGIKEWILAEAARLYETRENQTTIGPDGLAPSFPHDYLLDAYAPVLVG